MSVSVPFLGKVEGAKKLNTIDTSLYFLTVEKVAVSLPTKCLSDPTSGSVLIGNYRLGPAPFVWDEAINQKNLFSGYFHFSFKIRL